MTLARGGSPSAVYAGLLSELRHWSNCSLREADAGYIDNGGAGTQWRNAGRANGNGEKAYACGGEAVFLFRGRTSALPSKGE